MSASFYRVVVQAIILYGSETWVLLASMANRIEGMHTEFLKIIMAKRVKQLEDGTWKTPGAEDIREAAGNESAGIYVERQQTTVAQWVALRPLFEVCARETGYEGGGRRRKVWWRQEATEKNFGPPWKTRGKLKGGGGGAVGRWECIRTETRRDTKSGWVTGMLGRRRTRTRWENDLVWQSVILGQR